MEVWGAQIDAESGNIATITVNMGHLRITKFEMKDKPDLPSLVNKIENSLINCSSFGTVTHAKWKYNLSRYKVFSFSTVSFWQYKTWEKSFHPLSTSSSFRLMRGCLGNQIDLIRPRMQPACHNSYSCWQLPKQSLSVSLLQQNAIFTSFFFSLPSFHRTDKDGKA